MDPTAEPLAKARHLIHGKRRKDAVAILDKLLREHPGCAEALSLRGMQRYALEDNAGAEADFRALIALEPGDPEGHRGLGLALCRMQRLEEALGVLTRAAELDPHSAQAFHDKGTILGRLGRHAEAIDCSSQALLREPESGPTWFNRGTSRLALGDARQALRDLDEAVRLEPRNGRFLSIRARAHDLLEDRPKALADAAAAARLDPHDWDSVALHADLLSRTGRKMEALACYNRVVSKGKATARVRSARGMIHVGLGDLAKALADFDAAIKMEPDEPHHHMGRSLVFLQQKKFAELVEALDAVIRMQPDNDQALATRGNSLRSLGRLDEAVPDYDRAIALNPKQEFYWHFRARLRMSRLEWAGARSDFEEAMRLAPHDLDNVNGLAWLLAACPEEPIRDGARAEALARDICKRQSNSNHLNSLACALAEQGRWDEAKAVMERSLRAGTSPELQSHFREHLALIEQKQPIRIK